MGWNCYGESGCCEVGNCGNCNDNDYGWRDDISLYGSLFDNKCIDDWYCWVDDMW